MEMEVGSGRPVRFSRRERNKKDKLQRIKKAAFELFQERGYERATTQEIADRADVSSGTLFFYAKTKEDLLGLVMVADLLETLDRARATLPMDKPFPEKMAHLYSRLLRHHARHKELSRYFLQECLRERVSPQSAEVMGLNNQVLAATEEIVLAEQRAKRISGTLPVPEVSTMCFWLFFGVLDRLVSGTSSLRECGHMLRRSYEVLMQGLKA